MSPRPLFALVSSLLVACGAAPARQPREHVVISVIGTNDLHGHVEALPRLSAYVGNLRHARAHDGAVLLLDAGDLFQGTLESNLEEGAPIVRAYAALGYDAVAIGNHEFDFGPAGPLATPASSSDDPRGALAARIAEAPFPFLAANLLDARTGALATLGTPNRHALPTVELERRGVRIGLIGITTEETLHTTASGNVADLRMRDLAETVTEHASALRAAGSRIVIVVAHAGGRCDRFDDPRNLASCDPDQEIMRVAESLPEGSVDLIVGGHTHRGMAHYVHGIPIIESFAYGASFGRVDLIVGATSIRTRVFPPTRLCAPDVCDRSAYEGQPLTPDPAVTRCADDAQARAAELRQRPLGVVLTDRIDSTGDRESGLGNLFTSLMLAARPEADVALYNGGGLRADLEPGPLTYGAFYTALPFDNRFALVRVRASELATMLRDDRGSILSIAGLRAIPRCDGGTLVELERPDGSRVPPDTVLTVVTSDFLATGPDFASARASGNVTVEGGEPMRDLMAAQIPAFVAARGGRLSRADLVDPSHPRLPTDHPVTCP